MKKSIIQQLQMKQEDEPEIEKNINVNVPALDMQPIADAIKELFDRPSPPVNVIIQEPEKEDEDEDEDEKPNRMKIEVERDGRGFIKSLMCTEIIDG